MRRRRRSGSARTRSGAGIAAGKLRTVRDARNRRLVPAAEVERLTAHPRRHEAGDRLSARNRFPGVVRSVEVDGVMALVEIEAGPFLVTAAITRDSVRSSASRPGWRLRGGEGDLGDGATGREMAVRSPPRSSPSAAVTTSRRPMSARA